MIINFKVLIVLGCILLSSVTSAKPSNSTQSAPRDNLTKEDIKLEDESTDADMRMVANAHTLISVAPSRGHPVDGDDSRTAVDAQPQATHNYYPPFPHKEVPPLGHSRPYFSPSEVPLPDKYFAQRGVGLTTPYRFQHYSPPPPPAPPASPLHHYPTFDASILGSGNFGVMQGGTFYPEEEMPYHPEDNTDFIYGDSSNVEGSPSTEGLIHKYTYPEKQFAHFRDFADINSSADSAFSQFVVVYAAKNSTSTEAHPAHPRNIFEQLQLLERPKEQKVLTKKEDKPTNSVSKTKLSKTKLQRKYKKAALPKSPDEETLLAVS